MINRFIVKQAGTRGRRGWRMPRAVAVAAGALLGILGLQGSPAWAQAGNPAPEPPTFFYSSDKTGQAPEKKEPLAPATDWVAVQLEPDASMAETEKEVKAKIQIDNGRAISEHKRAKILVFPVQAGKAESTKQQLRVQRQALKGVRHVVRVFEHEMGPVIETDEFVVRFKDSVTEPQAAALLARHGAVIVEPLGEFAPNGYLARVTDPERTPSTEVANSLYSRPDVLYSHPNLISPVKPAATVNDPYAPYQWALSNIYAPYAWNWGGGNSNVIIAVLDDGFDLEHEDLRGKWVQGYDFVDNDWDPRPVLNDVAHNDNHGTNCAGIAAATGNNGIGITGVAPYCRLMPLRIYNGNSRSDTLQPTGIAYAFQYAAQHGASVISNSWIGSYPWPVVNNAITYAATSGRNGWGCVITFAAGNFKVNTAYYPYLDNQWVICVAASNRSGTAAWYSNWGTNWGETVDLCAPGGGEYSGSWWETWSYNLLSTDRTGAPGYTNVNYWGFNGTSAACPVVAGVAALVLSRNPYLHAGQVHRLLRNTATKIDSANWSWGYYGNAKHSPFYGYGRVNAWYAVYYATWPDYYNN